MLDEWVNLEAGRSTADPAEGQFGTLHGRSLYGTMYGMRRRKKTTIYLPEELKYDIERVAGCDGRSEADVIREAVEVAMEKRKYPEPRIPLGNYELGAPDIAERAEELLEGFGR